MARALGLCGFRGGVIVSLVLRRMQACGTLPTEPRLSRPTTSPRTSRSVGLSEHPEKDDRASTRASFDLFGIVEGFHGLIWSHEDRLDMLRFMGRVGMTSYIYAPKEDPHLRVRWRDPYPKDQLAQFKEVLDTAREHGIDFHYAMSPGAQIAYSDTADYQVLLEKLIHMIDVGVRHFAVFFDDTPTWLEGEADRSRYGDLASAHIDLVNRLHEDLGERGCGLSVTPTTYTDAWGDREYLARLGEGVSEEIPFFWTGIDVVSREITAAHAKDWMRAASRSPIVWDNFPSNDYARWRPFLGPLRNRSPDLHTAVRGIVANPMNEPHASMIPLATLADYARDPSGYDPDRSLRTALETLYGAAAAELLVPFTEIYGDYGWDTNLFEPLFVPGESSSIPEVRSGLARLQDAMAELRHGSFAYSSELQKLLEELEPFVTDTAVRLERLVEDSAYVVENDRLRYRADTDRYEAQRTSSSVQADGDWSEWENVVQHPLEGWAQHAGDPPTVSFLWDEANLHLALQVYHKPGRIEEDLGVGEGAHVALVVDADQDDTATALEPDDLVLLLPVPQVGKAYRPLVQSMTFPGITAKTTAATQSLTFSRFFNSTFGSKPEGESAELASNVVGGGEPTDRGYQLMVSIPRQGRKRFRVSLSVVNVEDEWHVVWSLTRRNYPANPSTFAEIVLVD